MAVADPEVDEQQQDDQYTYTPPTKAPSASSTDDEYTYSAPDPNVQIGSRPTRIPRSSGLTGPNGEYLSSAIVPSGGGSVNLKTGEGGMDAALSQSRAYGQRPLAAIGERADLGPIDNFLPANEMSATVKQGRAEQAADEAKPRGIVAGFGHELAGAGRSILNDNGGGEPAGLSRAAAAVKSIASGETSQGLQELGSAVPFGGTVIQRGKELAQGKIRQAIGETLGDAAMFEAVRRGAPLAEEGLQGEAATGPARSVLAEKGTSDLKGALNTPAGKGGQRAAQMNSDLQVAQSDISQLGRDMPLKSKGAAKFEEAAENIGNRADELEEQAVRSQVGRHAEMPIDMKPMKQAALKAITPAQRALDPNGVKQLEQWVENIPDEMPLKDAVEVRVGLNKSTGNKFGKLQDVEVEGRKGAVKELRSSMDSALESAGEEGMKDINRRVGAMRNIASRISEVGPKAVAAEAKKGIVPDWLRIYSFAHPGGVAIGAGIHAADLFKPTQTGMLGKGLSALGDAQLTPETAKTPSYVGKQPIGMLRGAPIEAGPAPDTSGIIHGREPEIQTPQFGGKPHSGIGGETTETRPVRTIDLSDVPLSERGGVIRRQPFAPAARGLALPAGPTRLGLPDIGSPSMERPSPKSVTAPTRPIEQGAVPSKSEASANKIFRDSQGREYSIYRDPDTGKVTKRFYAPIGGKTK